MCTDVCVEAENEDKACGGTVLRCLADKIDDVTDDNCKQELLYFQKMEVIQASIICDRRLLLATLHMLKVCNSQHLVRCW